jgi:hypothetical protein
MLIISDEKIKELQENFMLDHFGYVRLDRNNTLKKVRPSSASGWAVLKAKAEIMEAVGIPVPSLMESAVFLRKTFAS